MARPPKLTDHQREQLSILEPALRNAVKLGKYQEAKRLTGQIQKLLRPTGHETRLMKSKNWFYEAAMDAGELNFAETGFIGIRKKVRKRTRIYLEATALLAVCYLRKGNLDKAEPYMSEVFENKNVIRSDNTRKKFKENIVERFQEEAALASLMNSGSDSLDVKEIQKEAGKLVSRSLPDEAYYEQLGNSLPQTVAFQVLKVEQIARKKLPPHESKFLPDPRDKVEKKKVGKTVFTSFAKRKIWRALCDEESKIYKTWRTNGIDLLLKKEFLTGAVVASLSSMNIAINAAAVSITALVIKLGVGAYCKKYKPEGIMEARSNA